MHASRAGSPILFGAVLLLASCTQGDRAANDEIAGTAAVSTQVGWQLGAVEARLRTAGFTPMRGDTVRQTFMSVAGTLFALEESEIQVYVYADHAAREHDTHRLDPHHVAPHGTVITWRMPATLIVSENLAAILLTHDAAVRHHVRQALAHAPDAGH